MVATIKAFLIPLSLVLLSLILAVKGQSEITADIGSKRYYIVTGRKGNWYQANLACAAAGMSLASIESDTEYTNLKNYLYNQNHLDDGFWLSGSNLADAASNVDYTWYSNGEKLNYSQFATGHPKDTAAYCIYTNAKFLWETQECASTTLKYFICSRPLVPNCGITGRCKRNRSFFY